MRIYGTSYLRNFFIYIPTQLKSISNSSGWGIFHRKYLSLKTEFEAP
jgi:hypothetical protein